jgi:16S rRNA (uracil1498-N3)-methyltransferase
MGQYAMEPQRMTRLIVDSDRLLPGDELTLQPDEAHYLVRVLRLQPGDSLHVRDGVGGQFKATLTDPNTLQLGARKSLPALPGPAIHLAFVPVRGKRMDVLLEKATELGVSALHPLYSSRSVRRDSASHQRWSRIVRAAAQQSGVAFEPTVHKPMALTGWLEAPSVAELRLLLSPSADVALRDLLPAAAPRSVCVLTGPEGGWADDEIHVLRQEGWAECSLGSLVLRAETAPLAALTVLRHRLSDLG